MKIVLDTHILLLALFFGGYPRQILEAVVQGRLVAYATRDIVEEYEAAVTKMKSKKEGKLNPYLLLPFTSLLHIVEPKPCEAICRNRSDDKFISCALTANALYVANAPEKILFIRPCKPVKIINAEGCCQFLSLCA